MNNNNRIIARIFGGLGNQLFCYAAARRMALANRAELVIDDISGFVRDFNHQRFYQLDNFSIPCRKATSAERLEPFSLIRRKLLRTFNDHLPFYKRNYIYENGMGFDERVIKYMVTDTIRMEGYWQSEKYFKDEETIIRSDLKFKSINDKQNINTANQITNNISIGVHVRFFDTNNINGSDNIKIDYYKYAYNKINSLIPNAHYFIFSDCPDLVNSYLPFPAKKKTFITHNQGDDKAHADLWLLSQCKHFIIANSTFSWWGAWLSEYKHKIVIAPDIVKSEGDSWWGFRGLLPDTWIKI